MRLKLLTGLKYLLYIILLLSVAFLSDILILKVNYLIQTTYRYLILRVLIRTFMLIILGAGLALPDLIRERNKSGRWYLDTDKLLFIVIPAMLTPIFLIFMFLGLEIKSKFLLTYLFNVQSVFYQFTCLIVGYFLVKSFLKRESM